MYQTSKPMIVFLAADLSTAIRNLMRRFIKEEILAEANTTEKLCKIDFENKKSQLPYTKIDAGFMALKCMKAARASDREVLEFKVQCIYFFTALLKKLMLKSPITYSLVRNLACFSPREMANNPERCRVQFKRVVNILHNANRILGVDCDVVLDQYASFLDSIPCIGREPFSDFDKNTQMI
ncbi:Uncharacterised protein at_DN0341, partial [Pycnogonum litorale]